MEQLDSSVEESSKGLICFFEFHINFIHYYSLKLKLKKTFCYTKVVY